MPAQTSPLIIVRENLDLTEKQSNRLVAHAALDDVTHRARLRHQWTHTHTARMLGVSQPFVDLVGNYLEYRRQRLVSAEKGIRPHGSRCAQLFLFNEERMPLDLINLGTSGDRTEQMAALLMLATYRKVRLDPDTAKTVERMLGRACGMAWEEITKASQRQRASRDTDNDNIATVKSLGVTAA
ncbi:hypothetical protein ACPCSE_29470 [Streptomyces cellulosae]